MTRLFQGGSLCTVTQAVNADFIVLWNKNKTKVFYFFRNREANEFMQFSVSAEEQFGLAVAAGSLCIHGKFVSILSVIRSMHHCDNLIIYPLSTVQLHTGLSIFLFPLSLSLSLFRGFHFMFWPNLHLFLKVERFIFFPSMKLQSLCSNNISLTITKHNFLNIIA